MRAASLASETRLVIHERIGNWARHLRPRMAAWPARLVETRTAADLVTALTGEACPLLVLDTGGRPAAALDELERALAVAPDTLALVLNPARNGPVTMLAREIGATLVLEGPVTPPAVAALLDRWMPISIRRAEAAGRPMADPPPTLPEPWCWLPEGRFTPPA